MRRFGRVEGPRKEGWGHGLIWSGFGFGFGSGKWTTKRLVFLLFFWFCFFLGRKEGEGRKRVKGRVVVIMNNGKANKKKRRGMYILGKSVCG